MNTVLCVSSKQVLHKLAPQVVQRREASEEHSFSQNFVITDGALGEEPDNRAVLEAPALAEAGNVGEPSPEEPGRATFFKDTASL